MLGDAQAPKWAGQSSTFADRASLMFRQSWGQSIVTTAFGKYIFFRFISQIGLMSDKLHYTELQTDYRFTGN